MKLIVSIDLDQLPAGVTVPDELATIVREVADKLERKKGEHKLGTGQRLYNFERKDIGYWRIDNY